MKAIILAGGFGNELKSVFKDIPKPMVLIAGKPFLEHLIISLRDQNITEVIIAVHHMADIIKSYFGDGKKWGINITYSEEEIPLGTAGAIKNAEKYIDDTFLVLNGDCFSQINIKDFLEFHRMKRSKSTIALTKTIENANYGNVMLEGDKIVNFIEDKSTINENHYHTNNGIYIFEPIIFDYIDQRKHVSLEKEIFPRLIQEGNLWGYQFQGYFIDIGRPETYYKLKMDFLKKLYLSPNETVKKAMQKITNNVVDLILVVDENQKLLGVLNDRIIRNFLLEKGNIESNITEAMIKNPEKIARVGDDKEKVHSLLLSSRHIPILDEDGKIIDVEFRIDKIKLENFPIIRGKAPFRISFAGGGTDLPHFFEKHGGVVINCTIDKYCYGTLIKRADSKIIINSDIYGELMLDSKSDFKYDGKFDLIKAIINTMKPDFGFELYLHNDIPPGRGLGSSATLAVLVVKLLSAMQDGIHDDYKIAELAHRAEREELNIKGGWQDQYAAVTGGFSFMEFNGDKTIIYPLRLKEEVINDLNHHLMLCYVGNIHFSGEQQENLEKSCIENEEEVINSLNELKIIAIEIKDSLLTNNLEEIGRLLHKSWINKKKCSKTISSPKIDRLYETAMQNGAYGGKLLGSGGGGYLLIFHSPKKRNQLVKALINEGGEIMNFNFEFSGTKVWNVKNSGNTQMKSS